MKYLIVFLLLAAFPAEGQLISTFVGNGTIGCSGYGGSATSAKINDPIGLTFDIHGNLFFANQFCGRVCKIDIGNLQISVAGNGSTSFSGDGGAATAAGVYPNCVAFDDSGNMYIADNNYRIRKVAFATGNISTIAGTGSMGYSGDGGPATAAKVYGVNGLCFDNHRRLYLCDSWNFRIRRIDTNGIITTFAGTGVNGFSGDGGPATVARIGNAQNIAIDRFDNIFIADPTNYRIRKVDTAGTITSIGGTGVGFFNGDGIPATTANFKIYKIAVDTLGNIFGSDSNNRIREIDTSGYIRTVAGNGLLGYNGDGIRADSAKISLPSGIALDNCGNVYFGDVGNNRIRKVTMPYPHAPATLVITPNTGDTICAGTAVTYAAATPASGTVSYQWRVNGAALGSGGSTYTYTPAAGDSVQCVVTHAMPCYIDTIASNTVYMVVRTLGIGLAGTYRAAIGSSVTVSATVTGADSAYSIEWRNRGVLFRTTTTPGVTYTKAQATDSITAAVISRSRDCTDTAYSAVHVVTDTALGIATPIAAPQPHGYPNPFSEQLYIDAGSAQVLHASLTNMFGQLVLAATHASPTLVLNTAHLPKGVYMLKLVLDDGRVVVERVVRE